jgi:hypothetical protein
MTGDKVLRSLAADFCISAVGGNITRVNGAIEILFELLKAARDAGGNVDAVDEIKIDWRAQCRATKTVEPANPPLPSPLVSCPTCGQIHLCEPDKGKPPTD